MKKKRLDDFPHRGRWSQILLRMKLTFVLVFCMLVQTFAAVNAQTVTLKKQNASLEEIIWELILVQRNQEFIWGKQRMIYGSI